MKFNFRVIYTKIKMQLIIVQSTLGNSNFDDSKFSISQIIKTPLQITVTLNVN